MLFANVCAGFFSFWYGVGGERWFWVFLASLQCLVHMGGASLAGPSVVHKPWVTLVCSLLDTPFGRRSVEALPL